MMPDQLSDTAAASISTAAPTDTADHDRYDAFVSYRRADSTFARLLEKTLNAYRPPETLAVPQRRLRVFRDEGDLTGTEYFKSIDRYLAYSNKLIVICSPAARQSTFVDDEIRRYVAHHGADNIVPVLLAGLPNNEARPDQAAEQAFPQALCDVLRLPLAVEYRGFDPAREKVDRGRFEGSWYTLLANLYGKSRDEIEQRDRVRRRRQRNLLIAITSAVFVGLASLAAVAWWQKLEADSQRNVALRGLSKYLASVSEEVRTDQPQTGLLLAVEAVRTTRDIDGSVTVEAQAALRHALAGAAGEPLGGQGGRVASSSISAGGQRAATLDRDGRLEVWDLLAPDKPPKRMVLAAGKRSITAFSDDGRWLALSEGKGDDLVLWQVDAAAPAARLGERAGSGARFRAFSPDSRWLATSDDDAQLRLWRLEDLAAPPVVLAGHTPKRGFRGERATLSNVVFDPAARWLFSTGYDNTARMWNLADRQASPQMLEGAQVFASGRFSADGQWFAQIVSAGTNAKRVALWQLQEGKWLPVSLPDAVATDSTATLRSDEVIGFLPQQPVLVTLLRNEVRLWNLGGATPTYRGIPADVAALDAGGAFLAIAVADTGTSKAAHHVRVFDLGQPQGEPLPELSLDARVAGLRFDPQARYLGIATADGRQWLARLRDHEPAARLLRGSARNSPTPQFTADGRWLLVLSGRDDASLRMWRVDNASSDPVEVDAQASTELSWKTPNGGGGGEPVGGLPDAIAVDPRGRWMAVPGARGTALLVDLNDPVATPRVLGGHQHAVTAAVFAPNGEWLATADWNHALRIWRFPDVERPALSLERPSSPHESSVSAIAVSPDGTLIATGGRSGEVALWKPAAAANGPRMLGGHADWITSLSFNGDGTRLLTTGLDGKVQIWRLDAPASERPVTIDAHRGGVIDARFFNGGRRMVTAGMDALVRIWTVDAIDKAPITLRGHEASITGFDIEPGNRWLVTGSGDGTVRLWDLATPEALPTLLGSRTSNVNSVAISADGTLIAAGNLQGDVQIWRRTDPNAEPAVLRAVADRQDQRALIWSLRFSPDGRWISAMVGGSLRLWRLRVDEQLALACRIAGRNLRHATWQAHLERVPYRLSCKEHGVDPGWMATADELAKAGKTGEAAAMYETARKLDPAVTVDPQARAQALAVETTLATASSLARSGEREAALAAFANIRRLDLKSTLDPDAEVQRITKAQGLVKQAKEKAAAGALDPAIDLLRQARTLDNGLEIDPEREARRLVAPTFVKKGDALAAQGRSEEAIAEFERAIAYGIDSDLEPEDRARGLRADALMRQAYAAGRNGDLDAATGLFEQALAAKPALRIDPVAEGRKSVVEHRIEQAQQLRFDKKLLEAAALYRQAIEFDPKATLWGSELNELCWAAVQQNLARQVLDLCELAVTKSPDDGGIRDSRGVARALTNNSRGAIEDFTAYVDWAAKNGRSDETIEARKRWITYLRRGGKVATFQQLEAIGKKT